MERKYKLGDKVRMDGQGAAEMIVTGFPPEDPLESLDFVPKRNPPGNYYVCTWWEAGNRKREGEFHEDALVPQRVKS